MQTKICTKCKEPKTIDCFSKNKSKKDGLQHLCKACIKKNNIKDKEKIRKRNQKWNKNNPERKKELSVAWRAENQVSIKENRRIWNKEHNQEIREYYNNKLETDPVYAMQRRIVSAYNLTIVRKSKTSVYMERFGYTPKEIRVHLESLFTDGMTWDNYGNGGWEIDHIKPRSLFVLSNKSEDKEKNEKQLQKCWSLSNLQPLWRKDNILKGNNYDETEK